MNSIINLLVSIYESLSNSWTTVIDFFGSVPWPDWAGAPPVWLEDFTIADLMFGAGLSFLLGFVFVKFILDVVL